MYHTTTFTMNTTYPKPSLSPCIPCHPSPHHHYTSTSTQTWGFLGFTLASTLAFLLNFILFSLAAYHLHQKLGNISLDFKELHRNHSHLKEESKNYIVDLSTIAYDLRREMRLFKTETAQQDQLLAQSVMEEREHFRTAKVAMDESVERAHWEMEELRGLLETLTMEHAVVRSQIEIEKRDSRQTAKMAMDQSALLNQREVDELRELLTTVMLELSALRRLVESKRKKENEILTETSKEPEEGVEGSNPSANAEIHKKSVRSGRLGDIAENLERHTHTPTNKLGVRPGRGFRYRKPVAKTFEEILDPTTTEFWENGQT